MNTQKQFCCLLSFIAFASAEATNLIYETGFEPSTFVLGNLSGQDEWMVTPASASGVIQSAIVSSGEQALALVDGASFGRAQRNVSGGILGPVMVASYDMYFGSDWSQQMDADRFEAQTRIEVTGASGVYGLEFGFVKAPAGGYQGIPADGAGLYIEVGTETTPMGAVYETIDPSQMADTWHNYKLVFDTSADLVTLFVDNVQTTQVSITDDVLSISGLQLQNQRWGTNPSNNAALYFDNVYLSTVPEPASIGTLVIGLSLLLVRRFQRN